MAQLPCARAAALRKQHRLFLLMLATVGFVLPAAQPRAQDVHIVRDGPPPFGAPRTFKTGTGSIRGRILAIDTGQPVRRVQVTLVGGGAAPKIVMTSADGLYEFTELPAGRYTVSATKGGYVQVQYGQTRPFATGMPIELAEGQRLDKADIALPRGSVVAGTIVDEFGEPVTDASVTAMRSVYRGGRRRLMPAGRQARTDDRGEYRLFGLPPGEYYISAVYRAGPFHFEGPGAPSAPPNDSAPGYAPTYYPGTTSAADAQKVKVGLGQELLGTGFALAPIRLARVSGTAIQSDGRPAAGILVNLMPRGAELQIGLRQSGQTDANGNFTIRGVVPGDYTLHVRGVRTTAVSADGSSAVRLTTPTDGGAEPEFGSVPVSVGGEDVTNVLVVTSKGATVRGRVSFEGTGRPASLSGIRVTAFGADNEPVIFAGPRLPGAGIPGALAPDGSFELHGLSGTRLFRVAGLPQGWTVKSVTIEGTDVTDTGFDFKPGQAAAGIDIVVTSRATQVSGTVTESDGRSVKDYTVVLFAEDPALWGLPFTRYVSAARPDQQGTFKVRNLPAGDYLAVAVEYLPTGEWGDPEVLESLKSRAIRVSLEEGASKTVQLTLAR